LVSLDGPNSRITSASTVSASLRRPARLSAKPSCSRTARLLEFARHPCVEGDHLLAAGPGADRPEREHEIDDDARLDVPEVGQPRVAGDGAHGIDARPSGAGERFLVFGGDRHPLAEDVGLGVVDLEPRHAVDELEQGAVVVGRLVGGAEACRDARRVARRVGDAAGSVEPVGHAALHGEVEGQRRPLRENQHRRARPERMADTELVVNVRVGAGHVGDGVVAEHQPLEHRLVDRAADLLLVGADHVHARRETRRYDLVVGSVGESMMRPPPSGFRPTASARSRAASAVSRSSGASSSPGPSWRISAAKAWRPRPHPPSPPPRNR
jgi:hypothetical protein